MNDNNHSRIVVWLDPAAPQEGTLQALAGLGATAEILGLFIEDMSLLDISGLEVAREFTFDGAAARALDRGNLERQFRTHGTRMQSLFEKAARNIGASHSFRVTRGEPGAELLKISGSCDMLVLAHSRRHLGPRLTIRARLGELLAGGPPTLLLVQGQWSTGQCIAVLFDDSPESEAALRRAAVIAGAGRLQLSVWLPNLVPEERERLEARAGEILGSSANYSFRSLRTFKADELVRAADTENVRALVLPGKDLTETQRLVAELLDRVNCSLIVVH